MAAVQEVLMRCRVLHGDTHADVPLVGQGRQLRIQRAAQLLYGLGQGIAEVLVLATAEVVARHHHATAIARLVSVVGGDIAA
jgi:hypothetical protein